MNSLDKAQAELRAAKHSYAKSIGMSDTQAEKFVNIIEDRESRIAYEIDSQMSRIIDGMSPGRFRCLHQVIRSHYPTDEVIAQQILFGEEVAFRSQLDSYPRVTGH